MGRFFLICICTLLTWSTSTSAVATNDGKSSMYDMPESLMIWMYDQEQGFCHIHLKEMEQVKVPVITGEKPKGLASAPAKVKDLNFPHSDRFLIAWVGNTEIAAQKEGNVFVCNHCETSKEKWIQEQRLLAKVQRKSK